MNKIFITVFIILGTIALINYLIFFWINRRRLWKKEDEAFNALKKKEAMKELRESQEFFNSVKDFSKEADGYKKEYDSYKPF